MHHILYYLYLRIIIKSIHTFKFIGLVFSIETRSLILSSKLFTLYNIGLFLSSTYFMHKKSIIWY